MPGSVTITSPYLHSKSIQDRRVRTVDPELCIDLKACLTFHGLRREPMTGPSTKAAVGLCSRPGLPPSGPSMSTSPDAVLGPNQRRRLVTDRLRSSPGELAQRASARPGSNSSLENSRSRDRMENAGAIASGPTHHMRSNRPCLASERNSRHSVRLSVIVASGAEELRTMTASPRTAISTHAPLSQSLCHVSSFAAGSCSTTPPT